MSEERIKRLNQAADKLQKIVDEYEDVFADNMSLNMLRHRCEQLRNRAKALGSSSACETRYDLSRIFRLHLEIDEDLLLEMREWARGSGMELPERSSSHHIGSIKKPWHVTFDFVDEKAWVNTVHWLVAHGAKAK